MADLRKVANLATLRFRSSSGSLATAESAEGCWTFKRVGFLQTRVTIRPLAADTNCWMTKFAFSSETDDPLVRFTKIGGLLKLSSTVEILPTVAARSVARDARLVSDHSDAQRCRGERVGGERRHIMTAAPTR